jgi:hypothetical protein
LFHNYGNPYTANAATQRCWNAAARREGYILSWRGVAMSSGLAQEKTAPCADA